MTPIDYADWSKEDLVAEIKKLARRKKYGLVWEEKDEEVAITLNENLPVFEQVKSRAIVSDKSLDSNILIEGDNLHALTSLAFTHQGEIDLIYIDPPYNTGENDFKYNDDYVDSEDSFRHSKWLSFMHKRLKLAKTLLSDSGMFFCSIDDNEVGPLRLLLDEVFGEDNFINCITVKTKSSAGASGGGEDKKLKKNVEYLLFYAKNRAEFSFNPLYVYRPLEEVILEKEDEGKQFEYRKILINDGKKEKFKVIQDGGGNDIVVFKHSNYEITSIPEVMKAEGLSREAAYFKYFDKVFRTTNAQTSIRTRVAEATEGEDTLFSIEYVPRSGKNKGQVSTSHYMGSKTDLFVWLADTAEKKTNRIMKREKLGTLWSDLSWNGLASEGGIKFENGKKPIAFLKRILQLHPGQNIVAMDFFAGSGSLGHAVLDLNAEDGQNRTFVLATNNEKSSKVPDGICVEVTYPRMQNVINGYGRKEGIKSNLRYFKTKLVSSKPTDSNKKFISKHIVGILSVKEKCFDVVTEHDDYLVHQGRNKQMGIVFNSEGLSAFKKHCASTDSNINVYVFSLGNDDHSDEFLEFGGRVSSVAIPKALMNAYLRAQRMIGGAK